MSNSSHRPAQPKKPRSLRHGRFGSEKTISGQKPPAMRTRFAASRGFSSWLSEINSVLAITAYQSNQLIFVCPGLDGQAVEAREQFYPRCMGLGVRADGLLLATAQGLLELRRVPSQGESTESDAVFLPVKSHMTGGSDIHDVAQRGNGEVVFVATRFNCLAQLRDGMSFEPVWMPSWIDRVVAEDRCHLNGMAMLEGSPAFVTALSRTNSAAGWRAVKRDGGVVVDVRSNEIVVHGLSMPHSPRMYRNRLWIIQSGTGEFGYVDLSNGEFEPVCFLNGFARGLTFHGRYAVIGVSRPRKEKIFTGLPLQDRLAREKLDSQCYVAVIDLDSGQIVHRLDVEGGLQELYDIQLVPEVQRPRAVSTHPDALVKDMWTG